MCRVGTRRCVSASLSVGVWVRLSLLWGPTQERAYWEFIKDSGVIDGRGCTRFVCERVYEAVAWDAGVEEEEEEEEEEEGEVSSASASGRDSGSGVLRRSAPPSVVSSEGYGGDGSSLLVRFQFMDVVLRLALSKYVKVRGRRGYGYGSSEGYGPTRIIHSE
jgi:hypothetical protein